MPSSFTQIDLSRLSAPDVVQSLDYEATRQAIIEDFRARNPEDYDAIFESDPAIKVLEVVAYREMIVRQRVNDAARAVLLATAGGSDLDHLAALFNVERLVVDPGDPDASPPVPPTMETDADLRSRTQIALEGVTTAGSEGSYVFHALSADGNVKDVTVASPTPGDVVVTVLSRSGDGTPDAALLQAVEDTLSADTVRPLTDRVTVQPATVATYTLEADITVFTGPNAEVVRQTAEDAVTEAVADLHGLGKDVPLSALYAALHQPGVHNVTLTAPAADIINADHEAAFATSVTVTQSGTGY